MIEISALQANVAAQYRLMDESGRDESGYIRQFGSEAGRQKYASDKARLSVLQDSLAEEQLNVVMASLLED
jgi:hypothetical protein